MEPIFQIIAFTCIFLIAFYIGRYTQKHKDNNILNNFPYPVSVEGKNIKVEFKHGRYIISGNGCDKCEY